MPVPALVRLVAAPLKVEPIVFEALLTVIVDTGAKLMVLPESTMAPEPEANVRLPASTVPLVVMVPAAKPVAPLPKLRLSLVVVVTLLPLIAVEPVVSVVQPAVAVPVVGAAHVPLAVPKLAVALLLSQ